MRKVAIFNVGGASSAYIEYDDKNIVVDLGAGNDFSPVDDFLTELYRKREDITIFNQIFLSHLDNDHISDFQKFQENLPYHYITVPSNNPSIHPNIRVNTDLINDSESAKAILKLMHPLVPGYGKDDPNKYEKPLISCIDNLHLFYLHPYTCQKLDEMSESEYLNYKNNISLVLFLDTGNSSVLFPGDIMPDGMKFLIDSEPTLKNLLEEKGVDFFITPHHGLDTSFSSYFYEVVKNNKAGLHIISEKSLQKSESDSRHPVDTRYQSTDYAYGKDVINGKPGTQYGIITSRGHLVIDFDKPTPSIKRCFTNEELLAEFT